MASIDVLIKVELSDAIDKVQAAGYRLMWLALAGAKSPQDFYSKAQGITMDVANAEQRVADALNREER